MKQFDINCALIVLYSGDKVLLQKRTLDAPTLPGYWAFFGGGLEKNETPLEAVVRETQEELGYSLNNPTFLLEKVFYINDKVGFMSVFIEKYFEGDEKLICYEGENFEWFTCDEIAGLKMIQHDVDVLYEVFKAIKNEKN